MKTLAKGTQSGLGFLVIIAIGCLAVPISSPMLVAPAQAAGNAYYVATTGNDANPGTQDKPWRTIQRAANVMVAGDTTTVLAGDYAERVQVTRSGASGAPITYRAGGTVTMNGFTVKADYVTIAGFDISNTANDATNGWGIYVAGSYCVIDSNYVHYATRGGITVWAAVGSGAKASHCVVRNNRLYRNALDGIEVYGTDNLIEGNEIWGTIQYHPQWTNPPSWADADGIRFFGVGHTIRKNYIHDIKFGVPENVNPHIDCFQTWSDSYHEAAQNVTIEQNVCSNSQVQAANESGQGFMLEKASNLTIRNNIILAYKGVNSVGSQGLVIVNNTLAGDLSLTTAYHPMGIGLNTTPNTTIKNNIIYNFPATIINIADDASRQGLDIGYDCVYRSDGRTPSGTPYAHDLWNVNPLFVNAATNDFHLRAGSPAIDAGLSLATVVNDLDGTSRPRGAGYDIGAYEAPNSPAVTPSPTATPLPKDWIRVSLPLIILRAGTH